MNGGNKLSWILTLLLTFSLLSCNTATKTYLTYPFIKVDSIPTIQGEVIPFKTLGLYPGDYGMYTDTAWAFWEDDLFLNTRKLSEPISIDWVTQAQQTWEGLTVHPFYFSTGGVASKEQFKPPFHIQVKCDFLYRNDILTSVWLLNYAAVDSTRELDLFETGLGDLGRHRLWFADHFAGPEYQNRVMSATELIFPPDTLSQIDIYVYKNYALRYIDGKLVKKTIQNLDYYYNILVTIIVCNPFALNADWYIDKIRIERL